MGSVNRSGKRTSKPAGAGGTKRRTATEKRVRGSRVEPSMITEKKRGERAKREGRA